MITTTEITGIPLIKLRLEAMSKRLGAASPTQQYQLLHEEFGSDVIKGKIADKIESIITTVTQNSPKRLQDFFYITEGKMANRIVFFKIGTDILAPYKIQHFYETMSRSPYSNAVDNKAIFSAHGQPKLVSIVNKNDHLNIRWCQIRNAEYNNNVKQYYFMVEATINLQNGLCIMYMNKPERGDDLSGSNIALLYKSQIFKLFNCNADDIIQTRIAWGLSSKLISILSSCPTMKHTPPLLQPYNNQKVTCVRFQGEGKEYKNRLIDDEAGDFSEAETMLIVEKLNNRYYSLHKLGCSFNFGTESEPEIMVVDILEDGQIQTTKGLLVEGEVNCVINELMQRTEIEQRPTFCQPEPLQVVAAV